jgi:hypothetical protein
MANLSVVSPRRREAEGLITMVSQEDNEQLDRATQLLRDVIARHRGEDLRAVSILTEAIHDIRVGTRYLSAFTPPRAQP